MKNEEIYSDYSMNSYQYKPGTNDIVLPTDMTIKMILYMQKKECISK